MRNFSAAAINYSSSRAKPQVASTAILVLSENEQEKHIKREMVSRIVRHEAFPSLSTNVCVI